MTRESTSMWILTGLERGRKHLEWLSNTGKGQETLRDPTRRYAQGPAGHLAAQVGSQGSWGRENCQSKQGTEETAASGSLDFNFQKMKINENKEGRLRGKRVDIQSTLWKIIKLSLPNCPRMASLRLTYFVPSLAAFKINPRTLLCLSPLTWI